MNPFIYTGLSSHDKELFISKLPAPKTMTLDNLCMFICSKKGIQENTLKEKNRKREILQYRQWCYWAYDKYYADRKEERPLTLSKIGEYFNQDHATVLHAITIIGNLVSINKQGQEFIDLYIEFQNYLGK